jgi:hypothetical protein
MVPRSGTTTATAVAAVEPVPPDVHAALACHICTCTLTVAILIPLRIPGIGFILEIGHIGLDKGRGGVNWIGTCKI